MFSEKHQDIFFICTNFDNLCTKKYGIFRWFVKPFSEALGMSS